MEGLSTRLKAKASKDAKESKTKAKRSKSIGQLIDWDITCVTGDVAALTSSATLVFSFYGSAGNVQNVKATSVTMQKDARNVMQVSAQKSNTQKRTFI